MRYINPRFPYLLTFRPTGEHIIIIIVVIIINIIRRHHRK